MSFLSFLQSNGSGCSSWVCPIHLSANGTSNQTQPAELSGTTSTVATERLAVAQEGSNEEPAQNNLNQRKVTLKPEGSWHSISFDQFSVIFPFLGVGNLLSMKYTSKNDKSNVIAYDKSKKEAVYKHDLPDKLLENLSRWYPNLVFLSFGETLHDPRRKVTCSSIPSVASFTGLQTLSISGVTINNLRALASCSQLKALHLSKVDGCQNELGQLSVLPELQTLNLSWTKLQNCKFLAAFKSLTDLDLRCCGVFNANLTNLTDLTLLRALRLKGNSEITAVGLQHLTLLANLETLSVEGSPTTIDFLKHLPVFKKLHTLEFEGMRQRQFSIKSEDYLQCIGNHTTLTSLDLAFQPITDSGLGRLTVLPKLIHVSLRCDKITDAGLQALIALTGLQTLKLEETQISDNGLEHLTLLKDLQVLFITRVLMTDREITVQNAMHMAQLISMDNGEKGNVTDSGLHHIVALTNLHTLKINFQQITSLGVNTLTCLTKLHTLDLNVPVDGLDSLTVLAGLRLRTLTIMLDKKNYRIYKNESNQALPNLQKKLFGIEIKTRVE